VNSQFSCFPPCFPLLSHCFPPRGALLSSRASRCCCRKWTMSGLGGRRDVAECSRALGAAPVRGADCQWLCGGCFRAHGSWPAGWPCAADGVGAQRAGALADSLLWCGTACAVLGCKANRHFMLFGSGLGDVPAAVSAAAEIWHTVCSWCAALMTLVDANLCHDQRTSSAGRGVVFESLAEAQEASLLCLPTLQNHNTDSMILDRLRLADSLSEESVSDVSRAEARRDIAELNSVVAFHMRMLR
jgi:hypothetical protein